MSDLEAIQTGDPKRTAADWYDMELEPMRVDHVVTGEGETLCFPLAVSSNRQVCGHPVADLFHGHFAGVAEVAEAAGCDPSYVRRMLKLTLPAPEMVERVLDGLEGDEEGIDRLARGAGVVWGESEAGLSHGQ